jgi:hypothetical protein
MTNHRIDLQAPEEDHGKTRMSYLGQPIGASNSPIYAAARWLLANGLASPDAMVATYRGETLCMSGKASESAKWTVKERDRGGLSLEPNFAFPRMAQKPAKSLLSGTTPAGTRACGFWAMTAHAIVTGALFPWR